MSQDTPTPNEVGIFQPAHVDRQLFNAGYKHAFSGGQITQITHLKLSFREGFRAAKLYVRELRKQQGILNFPLQGKIQVKAA